MRGSVRKRGETWTWYLWVPDALSGKPRQRSKGGFRTKKACQDALNDALADLRKGTFIEPSRRTIASFLTDEWLPAVAAQGRRPGTVANYRIHVTAHIIPALGGIELQQLSPAHLNSFYRALLSEGRRNGRPMAQKTVRNVHNILHRALQDALRWGLVARNVASAANPPAGKSPERAVWTPTELGTFVEHVRSDRLFAVWMLFATTGMRRSEVAGLRTVDVDLAAARVNPRLPRVLVDHQVVVSEPKSRGGGRWGGGDPASAAGGVCPGACRKPSGRSSAPATWTLAFSSPGPTVDPSTRRASRSGSSSTWWRLACRGTPCIACATATPPRRSRPACL